VGDSKRALDEYTSEIFLGGRNTIVMHNTCEDSLLAAPIILDLVLLAELIQRIQLKKDGEAAFHGLHPIAVLLSYLTKVRARARRARMACGAGRAIWVQCVAAVRVLLVVVCAAAIITDPCTASLLVCMHTCAGAAGAARHPRGQRAGQAARHAGKHHARVRGPAARQQHADGVQVLGAGLALTHARAAGAGAREQHRAFGGRTVFCDLVG
jgi:hypothetical protein